MAIVAELQFAPAGWVGLCLIFAGLVLLAVDIKVTNHGLLTVLAALSLLGGGWVVLGAGDVRTPVALAALALMALVMAAGSFVLLRSVRAARKLPPATGAEAMIGEAGVVKEPIGTETPGWVIVHGERWRATLARTAGDVYGQEGQIIGVGGKVMVIGLEGGKVVVVSLDRRRFDAEDVHQT